VGGHRPPQRALRAPPLTVALATCAEVPDLDEDGPALAAALREHGIEARAGVWDDPAVGWDAFELVVLRSTWDYAERRAEFLRWIDRLPRVLNASEVVRWNTDKRYLDELAGAGLPVVPTRFLEPGDPLEAPAERFVVKPAISAGARNTASYEAHELELARRHLAALHTAGLAVMVQPYIEAVDVVGEAALIWLGGEYSHAVTKSALLQRGQAPGTELYLEETIAARTASPAERDVGARVLAALPFDPAALLYARIDLLPTREGPVVLEVELTEPSLFLGYEAGAAERLAAAIARRLGPCP
jgi:glutathione synthase/RimK-type ligase-like ATP-grasp enzyme